MTDFFTYFWPAVASTVISGVILLGVAKKMRDEKARKEKVPAPIAVRKDDRG